MQGEKKETVFDRIYSQKVRLTLLLFQLILLYLPTLMLFSIQTDNGPIPASLCYFFSLVFVPYLLVHFRQLKWPPWYLTGFFVFVLVWAAICMPEYGLSKSVLHWAFGLYLLVMVPNVGKDFSKGEWVRLLEIGACTFAVLHFGYMIIHREYLLTMLRGYFDGSGNGYFASLIPSLTRGGRHLDATWLALGAYFVRGKKKAVYVTYAVLFSFVSSSRVGIVAIGMLILWSLFYDPMYRLRLKNLKWYVLYAIVIVALLVFSGSAQGLLSRISIQVPPPAQILGIVSQQEVQEMSEGLMSTGFLSGRDVLWNMVPPAIAERPVGYGVGNAIRVFRMYYGFDSYEDVMHNVFLQLLMDEGVIGAVWFVGMCIAFFVSQFKQRPRFFAAPIAGYFLTYLVLSLVQFHGGEALMQFVLAISLVQPQLLFGEPKNALENTPPLPDDKAGEEAAP
ncbi:MAG: O-antigen ligase family protein [Clostridia bacterium]|nr:O-antigen ligase family protein [Clostridia bacterium]